MALFSIIVDIAARTANIEAGLDRVEQRLTSFSGAVKGLTEVLSVGAIASFAEHLTAMAAEIDHASIRAGVSVQAFQELSYAAKQSGVGSDELGNALIRMNRSLSLASTGGKQQVDTLKALGLTFQELEQLRPDQQFEVLADRINKLASPADRARAEIVLFGRAGGQLGVLMAQGADGIEKMRKEAETLGGVMSDETVKNLEEAHKSIDRLETSFSTLAATVLGKVAPAMKQFMDDLTKSISGDQSPSAFALKHEQEMLEKMTGGNTLTSLVSSKADIAKQRALVSQMQQQLGMQSLMSGAIGGGGIGDLSKGGAPGFQAGVTPDLSFHPDIKGLQPDKMKTLMEQWDRDTASIQNVARDNYDKTKLIIDELYKDGVIPWSELQDRDKKAWEKYQNTINSELQEIHVNMTKLFPPDQLQIGISTFVGTIKGVFDQTAHESGNFGKNLVKNLLTALEDRAIFNAIEAIGSALSDALTGATGAGGANESQGILAGVISGFFGPQGAGHASGGFVTGGQSYMVGERGPEMFTPGASGWVSPNGSGMVFAPTYHIVAPNGDQQLRAALPGLLSQTAARSKQDMLEAFRRNNLRAPARA